MYKKKTTKTKEKHICSECIAEFDGKELFSALVPDREYYTNYCEKCIKKLGIKEYTTYFKPRKKREVKPKTDTTPKTTTTRKKTTTARKTTKKTP